MANGLQQTNVRGVFLITQGFLRLLGKERKGSIVTLTTAAAVMVFPGMSSYSLSKLASMQLQAFIAAENPNVTAVALHPGIVLTDMTLDYFLPYAKDTPELVGGVGVWLSTEKAEFLNGRYIEANVGACPSRPLPIPLAFAACIYVFETRAALSAFDGFSACNISYTDLLAVVSRRSVSSKGGNHCTGEAFRQIGGRLWP